MNENNCGRWATAEECSLFIALAETKKRACIKCEFFDDNCEEPTIDDGIDGTKIIRVEGSCFRYPPIHRNEDYPEESTNVSTWVKWKHWCGEFRHQDGWESRCEPCIYAKDKD